MKISKSMSWFIVIFVLAPALIFLINLLFFPKNGDAEKYVADYIDNFIAGTYAPVSDYKGVATMILSKNGSVKGFKGFDTYELYAFFGTFHPTGNNDALVFYDTVTVREATYKWQYSDSTFILTRMHRNTGSDMYHVGTEKYEFTKQ
jgi:hypothetical protein